jgi:hypothetical protein
VDLADVNQANAGSRMGRRCNVLMRFDEVPRVRVVPRRIWFL